MCLQNCHSHGVFYSHYALPFCCCCFYLLGLAWFSPALDALFGCVKTAGLSLPSVSSPVFLIATCHAFLAKQQSAARAPWQRCCRGGREPADFLRKRWWKSTLKSWDSRRESVKHLWHAYCMYMRVLRAVSCDELSAFLLSLLGKNGPTRGNHPPLTAPSLSASVLRPRVERAWNCLFLKLEDKRDATVFYHTEKRALSQRAHSQQKQRKRKRGWW